MLKGAYAWLLVPVGAALWLLKRLAEPTFDALGRRLASWLIPEGLPVTTRPAQGTAILARWVMPRTKVWVVAGLPLAPPHMLIRLESAPLGRFPTALSERRPLASALRSLTTAFLLRTANVLQRSYVVLVNGVAWGVAITLGVTLRLALWWL